MTARSLTALAVLTILVIGAGAVVTNLATGKSKPAKAKSAIVTHPPPALYPPAQVRAVGPMIASARAEADRRVASYLRAHPGRDDAAFVRWAAGQAGPPPSASARRRELVT